MSVRHQQTCTLVACPQRLRKHQENTQGLLKYSKNVWRNFHPHQMFFQYQRTIGPFWKPAADRFLSETTSLEQLGDQMACELGAPRSASGLWPLWVKVCLFLCNFPAKSIHILSPKLQQEQLDGRFCSTLRYCCLLMSISRLTAAAEMGQNNVEKQRLP